MKSILRLTLAASFLSLASVATTAPAVAAGVEMVVVHVENAPYKRGAIIDGNKPLKLKAGWTVTLVASDGSFVTMTGPSERVPAKQRRNRKGDPKLLEALRALLAAEEMSTASLGAVRSGRTRSDFATLPNAWAVNVYRSGPRCIRPDAVSLWRKNPSRRARLKIRALGGGRSAKAVWPAGRDTLLLDGSGFRDGSRYVIEVSGRRVEITMHVMPERLTRPAEQAAWMARNGCNAQALALLETVR